MKDSSDREDELDGEAVTQPTDGSSGQNDADNSGRRTCVSPFLQHHLAGRISLDSAALNSAMKL